MPIDIEHLSAQIEVDAAAGDADPAATRPAAPEALQRWQALARRDQQDTDRLAAWNFDD